MKEISFAHVAAIGSDNEGVTAIVDNLIKGENQAFNGIDVFTGEIPRYI